LVVGYDTRFASEDFAAAAAQVVAANGIRVWLCPRATPTPVISYGVISLKAGGAIIITASHNPATWNGFKYKSEDGASASNEVIADLEGRISAALSKKETVPLPLAEGLERGIIQYFDLAPAYQQHLANFVDLERLRQAESKIVADYMYGAGAGYLRAFLQGGKIELLEINAERNPLFPGIQPEPIAPNLTKLSATVRELGASVGLATDGDADRLGIVDEKGIFLTPLQVFALLSLYLLEIRGERGPIVKTPTTSGMLYKLGEMFGVPVYETPVGFKNIAPKMMAENALIGGEESGGFGFRGHVPERDGILASLYFLDLMFRTNKTPSQLIDYLYQKVGQHHYQRLDLPLPLEERQRIIENITQGRPEYIDGVKATFDTTDGLRFLLEDGSWLLIRSSGTEPLLRLYAESDSPARVERLLKEGRELVGT
jgi:phosphomannomutase